MNKKTFFLAIASFVFFLFFTSTIVAGNPFEYSNDRVPIQPDGYATAYLRMDKFGDTVVETYFLVSYLDAYETSCGDYLVTHPNTKNSSREDVYERAPSCKIIKDAIKKKENFTILIREGTSGRTCVAVVKKDIFLH